MSIYSCLSLIVFIGFNLQMKLTQNYKKIMVWPNCQPTIICKKLLIPLVVRIQAVTECNQESRAGGCFRCQISVFILAPLHDLHRGWNRCIKKLYILYNFIYIIIYIKSYLGLDARDHTPHFKNWNLTSESMVCV